MKNAIKSISNKWSLLAFSLLASVYSFAQDVSRTTTQTTETNAGTASTDPVIWYNTPWAWIAGAVLLILILFLAFRGNGTNRQKVTRTTTTVTEINND